MYYSTNVFIATLVSCAGFNYDTFLTSDNTWNRYIFLEQEIPHTDKI